MAALDDVLTRWRHLRLSGRVKVREMGSNKVKSQTELLRQQELLYEQRAQEMRESGRYTLEGAAAEIEKNTGEHAAPMLVKLMQAVKDGRLVVHECGKKAKYTPRVVRTFTVEVYWDKLNDWLAENEPEIYKDWQFPKPTQTTISADTPATKKSTAGKSPVSSVKTHRLAPARSHALTAVIDSAKNSAVKKDDYLSVWAALVVLAESKDRPAPLLGYVDNEGIKYQADNGVKFFTKNALRSKMKRTASAQ